MHWIIILIVINILQYPDGFTSTLLEKDTHHLLGLAVLLSYENASRQNSVNYQPSDHLILTFGKEYKGTMNAR